MQIGDRILTYFFQFQSVSTGKTTNGFSRRVIHGPFEKRIFSSSFLDSDRSLDFPSHSGRPCSLI